MSRPLSIAFVCIVATCAQNACALPQKPIDKNKPVCSSGAICFSGKVSAGQSFHKDLNGNLAFDLKVEPDDQSPSDGKWTIDVSPKQPEGICDDLGSFATVVTSPFRGHNDLEIDTSYDWTAETEVSESPRVFSFVTTCKDYRIESRRLEIVLWPYNWTEKEYNKALADLGSSQLGTGRLWITDSRVSHALDPTDEKLGKIEWMQFTVEIRLPHQKTGTAAAKVR